MIWSKSLMVPPGFGVHQPFRLRGAPKRRSGATAAGALKAAEGRRTPGRYRDLLCVGQRGSVQERNTRGLVNYE